MSWTLQPGSQVTGADTEAGLGMLSVISNDGLIIAYAERSDPGNDLSPLDVRIRRRVGTTWQNFGTSNIFSLDTSYINTDLSVARHKQLFSISDNGHTIALGDPAFNSAPGLGRVRVYRYDSGTDAWVIKGSVILNNGTAEEFGFSVALSGDGSHLVASTTFPTTNTPVRVYGFSTDANDWLLQQDLQSPDNINGFNGLSLAITPDGTTVAIGNEAGPSNGLIRIWRKSSPSLALPYSEFSNPIDGVTGTPTNLINNPADLGGSIDLNETGNILVAGDSGADAGRGAIKAYQYTGGLNWVDYGEVLQVTPMEAFGEIVSITPDGTRISVSAYRGEFATVMNSGYTQVFELQTGSWSEIDDLIGIAGIENFNAYAHLSGSGRKIVQGSPGIGPGFTTGTVRVLTLGAEIEVYDKDYSVIRTEVLEGNFITKTGLKGTDNDPNGLPLTIDEIDATGSLVPFNTVPNNLNGNGYAKVAADFSGGPLYLNADGGFRYENDGIGIIAPGFEYSLKNGLTSSPGTAVVLIELITEPLTFGPTPLAITVDHNANGGDNFIITNPTGSIVGDGGVRPYSFTLLDGPGITGTLAITPNGDDVDYVFTPNEVDAGGPFVDTFSIELEDLQPAFRLETVTVSYFINPELQFNLPLQPTIVRKTDELPIENNLSGMFNADGGSPQPTPNYTFSATGGTTIGSLIIVPGKYGTLRIDDTEYEYRRNDDDDPNFPFPNTIGTYNDAFVVMVVDGSGDYRSIDFIVRITVTSDTPVYQLLPIMDQGMVIKTEGGSRVITQDLTGILAVSGGSPASFGVTGGTVIGSDQRVITSNGTFVIDTTNGSYEYSPNFGAIGNTIAMYRDTFTLTSTSTTGASDSTTYEVVFEIRPQLLLGSLSPSAGAICRNTNNDSGVTNTVGLEGSIVRSVNNGVPPFTYGIEGGNQSGLFVSKLGELGTLFVNSRTGEYAFDVDSLMLSTVPGVYLDQYGITVTDDDDPPNMQTLIYNISATVNSTPLGLLPIFRHSTTREIAGYWNRIVHNVPTTPSISANGTVRVPNTELLVVGQTETTTDKFRDADAIMRQLLGDAAYDRSNPSGDVLINVKNNSQDVLDTEDVDGVQTRSFQVVNGTVGTFIVELVDILSSQHSNFLLNRYRSNVGEAVMVIYADDDVDPPTSATALKILNQVELLLDLGVRTVIGVMMAASRDPNNAGDKKALEDAQSAFLNEIDRRIAGRNASTKSVIVRYNTRTRRYLNLAGPVAIAPTTQADIEFTVPGYMPSFNLYSSLFQIAIIPRDSTSPLRIVIKSIDTVTKEAVGEVIYGTIPIVSPPTTFVSSRVFTDGTNVVRTTDTISQVEGVDIAAGQVPDVILRQGGGGRNVEELQAGDVLYPSSFTYLRPRSARLLISSVSGFESDDIAGKTIYLQIDDGVRFPDNPVFPVRVTSVNPIVHKYNSNTLEEVTPTDSIVKFGFDYELNIQNLQDSFGAGGLELYTQFPRLGFVTLYFATDDNNDPVFNAYGRGAIVSISRS
jgi:hypothetical protein